MTAEIQTEWENGVAWITLNRPTKANAMTVEMSRCVREEILRACADESICAIVLSGAGERIFTAGVDVREVAPDGDIASQKERRSKQTAALQDTILDSPKPIVLALNGAAIGAGAMMALMADACVAVSDASLSLPEIDIGIASFSGANILEAVGGRKLAVDLILSGRRISAQQAQAWGLVRTVVERSEFRDTVAALASELGAKPAGAYADIKRWTNRKLKAALAEAREAHADHRATQNQTGDNHG